MSALHVVQKFFPKVTEIVDAKKPAMIEVTKKDASSKEVKNHSACAMAVACKRSFHLDGVIIARSTAYLVKGKKARRFLVPSSVAKEVVSFDRGAGFAPGKYHLAAVHKTARLGTYPSGKGGGGNHGGNPRFRHLTVKVRAVLGGQHPEE